MSLTDLEARCVAGTRWRSKCCTALVALSTTDGDDRVWKCLSCYKMWPTADMEMFNHSDDRPRDHWDDMLEIMCK